MGQLKHAGTRHALKLELTHKFSYFVVATIEYIQKFSQDVQVLLASIDLAKVDEFAILTL